MSGENPDYQATGAGIYQPDNQPEYEADYLGKNWGDEAASENQAALARAEYDDYKRRFVPIENELIGQLGNRGVYAENVNRATEAAGQAYGTSADEYRRGLSRYGVTASDEQVADQQRQMGLSSAASQSEAANRTRLQTKNRNMQLLGGGLAPSASQAQEQ